MRSATSWGASNQQHPSSQDASGKGMQYIHVPLCVSIVYTWINKTFVHFILLV